MSIRKRIELAWHRITAIANRAQENNGSFLNLKILALQAAQRLVEISGMDINLRCVMM